MAHNIQERDQQTGLTNAWHSLTNVVDCVTRENSIPWDVVESPIFYKVLKKDEITGFIEEVMIQDPEFKTLLANDDWLPVGQPYGSSYSPSSIKMFFDVIEKGMGTTPYKIVSAGTVDNRQKVFASLKVTDGFRIGDRVFEDFITILDSFDKTTSLQAKYTNVCVVCQNTYSAAMQVGKVIGKAKHTLMIEENVVRLIDAIDSFIGTSATAQAMLLEADQIKISRDEARAWLTGVECRNADELTNGMKQKTARLMELFECGRGNTGSTRLDAFSAFTEFHTSESSNRKVDNAQYMTSEFGASSIAKSYAARDLNANWEKNVKVGERLLSEEPVLTA